MAARSSNEIIQEPYNPSLPPIIDLNSEDNLVYEHHQTDAGPDAYDFFTEKFVDFDSLKANEIDIQYLFYNQQWQNYFEMLNGFVYYDIVKYFWQKAKVYDRASADKEYKDIVEKNKELRGKTRKELGLKPYREREIRSNILGINVVITQAHIAKILGLDNKGEDIEVYDNKSKHLDSIHQDLFKPGCSKRDVGKIMHMKHTFEFAFRMCLSTIFTRKGGLDSISIPHKHFIWFLYKRVKVNLAKILFDHMCFTINEGRTKIPSVIHHPRLISELIRQTKLTDIVSAKEKLRVFQTAKYDASVLVNMKRKTKEEIIPVKTPLQQVYEKYFWCDGFPTISEHDNDEVIKNFLESVRRDTGVSVPRKMVVSVPNWDIFKGPRDITRNRRKPRTTEQEMIDEGSDDKKHDSADEIEEGERGAGNMMAEAVQKEKRTKKRHDRPSASEEDQNLAKPAKKLKVRTSKPKGKIPESNTSSIPVAQVIGSKPQPSSAKPSISQPPSSTKQTQPIDFTIPISVVLPDHKAISSSLSDTSTDSEEFIAKIIREGPKKTNLKKTTKRPIKKPIQLSSDEEQNTVDNTSIPEQPITTESVLEHLQQHLSGDAFTHSNPNSPRFPIIKPSTVQTIQEPPIVQSIQTPPPSLDHISQVNPPTFTPVQDDSIAHSEAQQESPPQSPNKVMTEQQHQSPPPEVYSDESSPSPSPQPVSDPLNKPLVLEEVLELYQHLTKAEHQIFKDSINLDDDIIPPNLSKIKIIELKRKKPEPTIPFDPSLPFFNSDSEPNLELLNNAIGIRLKRFKQREEEALIFPSDIDTDVRKLEYLFGKSLRILSTHLKDKIKGRGANTVRELFEIVEKLNAPRLTSYNHVKEQARIAAEEEEKRQAEIEHKRLAEQEALKLLVDRAVHIATFETNKINENQADEQDVTMLDQNLIREDTDINEDSDKGKKPIFVPTPSHSPMKIDIASTSSTIPPAVQDALDNLRTDMANEIDELRVDMRNDVNAAVESVHKRMDDMMLTLLKAIADVKKP
ncbi:NADH:ubiquinone reductase (H(+)-translocating) [Trifolium repens]|nr:NADH:ubiquinone reductase (H(+)-translocating) [Trifolium repens]